MKELEKSHFVSSH